MNGRVAVSQGFQYGLLIFTLTALIGLVNATKIFGTLSQDTLLTHLHSGTLGWITMGVVAVAVWLFGGTSSSLARNVMLSALATAAYVLAFWSGDLNTNYKLNFPNFVVRAVFGGLELVVIYGWWWWTVSSSMREGFGKLSVPKTSVVLALTTLVIGSTIGVIVQLLLATGSAIPTSPDLIGGHASAQVGGYLVLVSAGAIEWQLSGQSRTRAGLAQAWILFVGGLLLAMGVLMNVTPLLGIATLLQVVGIVLVVVRLGRRALAVRWGEAGGKRHLAVAIPWLALGLALEIILIQQFTAAQGDITKVSMGLNHALDHSMFVGVMTNVLFGAILMFTAGRPRVWPWADNVIFWGLNLGAAAFVLVLLVVGSSSGARPFASPVSYTAPVMGISVLLGIVTFWMRLAPQRMPAAAPLRA